MTSPIIQQLETENRLLEAENRVLRERARKAERKLAALMAAIEEKARARRGQ